MLPDPVPSTLAAWLDVHDRVAPGLIEGLYAVGSVALDDWRPRSDIDIVACTADPATDADVDLLQLAHDEFVAAHDRPSVDGPYVAWGDLAVPPVSVMRPWTRDGELHHDGECFEINPITWSTLAAHGIAVRGASADRLGVASDADACRAFVRANVDTYWRAARDELGRAVGVPERTNFPAVVVEWCALGMARMCVTADTGEVVSKTAAGRWAGERFPAHAALLEQAVGIRAADDPDPVDEHMVVSTIVFMDDAIARVTGP